jgi:hypothetical protein
LVEEPVEVFLAGSNELSDPNKPDTPLVDQPPHQPRCDAQPLSGGFDRERRRDDA